VCVGAYALDPEKERNLRGRVALQDEMNHDQFPRGVHGDRSEGAIVFFMTCSV
jgi:hypothetical protein